MANVDVLGPASALGAVTSRPTEYRNFGTVDTWFKDCTDPLTEDGTALEAAFTNGVLANLRGLIRGNGPTGGGADVVTLNNADDMIWRACQHLYQRGQPTYAQDTGTANNIIVALTPAPAELKEGMKISVKIAANNTGATDITVNSVVKDAKTVGNTEFSANALVANQLATFQYTGVYWQLVSVSGAGTVSLPKAKLTTTALTSLAFGTYTAHTLAVASSADLTVTLGGGNTSFQVDKAGTYLLVSRTFGRIVVNKGTNSGGTAAVFVNGVNTAQGGTTGYLPSAADLTFPTMVSGIFPLVPSDVVTFTGYAAATYIADYTLGQALAGAFDIVRLGP